VKKVFLDLGANTGQSVDYFRRIYESTYRLDESVIDRLETNEFEIHCFEANPNLYHKFAKKNVILHKCAVWIEDGEIDFSVRSSLGSTLYESKTTGGSGTTITVESIDISKFIKDNFDIEDHLIVKMDIEGAEFKVIDKLAKDGTLEYIDKINVEYHAGKVPEFGLEDVNRCRDLLEDSGVDIIEWKRF